MPEKYVRPKGIPAYMEEIDKMVLENYKRYLESEQMRIEEQKQAQARGGRVPIAPGTARKEPWRLRPRSFNIVEPEFDNVYFQRYSHYTVSHDYATGRPIVEYKEERAGRSELRDRLRRLNDSWFGTEQDIFKRIDKYVDELTNPDALEFLYYSALTTNKTPIRLDRNDPEWRKYMFVVGLIPPQIFLDMVVDMIYPDIVAHQIAKRSYIIHPAITDYDDILIPKWHEEVDQYTGTYRAEPKNDIALTIWATNAYNNAMTLDMDVPTSIVSLSRSTRKDSPKRGVAYNENMRKLESYRHKLLGAKIVPRNTDINLALITRFAPVMPLPFAVNTDAVRVFQELYVNKPGSYLRVVQYGVRGGYVKLDEVLMAYAYSRICSNIVRFYSMISSNYKNFRSYGEDPFVGNIMYGIELVDNIYNNVGQEYERIDAMISGLIHSTSDSDNVTMHVKRTYMDMINEYRDNVFPIVMAYIVANRYVETVYNHINNMLEKSKFVEIMTEEPSIVSEARQIVEDKIENIRKSVIDDMVQIGIISVDKSFLPIDEWSPEDIEEYDNRVADRMHLYMDSIRKKIATDKKNAIVEYYMREFKPIYALKMLCETIKFNNDIDPILENLRVHIENVILERQLLPEIYRTDRNITVEGIGLFDMYRCSLSLNQLYQGYYRKMLPIVIKFPCQCNKVAPLNWFIEDWMVPSVSLVTTRYLMTDKRTQIFKTLDAFTYQVANAINALRERRQIAKMFRKRVFRRQ